MGLKKIRLTQGAKHIGARHITAGGLAMATGMDLIGRTALGGEKMSLKTIGKSAITGGAFELLHPGLQAAYFGVQLAGMGVGIADSLRRTGERKYQQRMQTGLKSTYTDSQQALTMRQAAVQAIQGSRMNARNALGGEASMMHRGWHRDI